MGVNVLKLLARNPFGSGASRLNYLQSSLAWAILPLTIILNIFIMINKQILLGRVGKDPEMNGSVCKFSIATTERWSKDGEQQEKTDWHNVVAFGKRAEVLHKYVNKGSLLYIEGKTRHSEYTDKDGNKRRSTSVEVSEFQFMPSAKKGETVTAASTHDDLPF